jgi:hypothetical protein
MTIHFRARLSAMAALYLAAPLAASGMTLPTRSRAFGLNFQFRFMSGADRPEYRDRHRSRPEVHRLG